MNLEKLRAAWSAIFVPDGLEGLSELKSDRFQMETQPVPTEYTVFNMDEATRAQQPQVRIILPNARAKVFFRAADRMLFRSSDPSIVTVSSAYPILERRSHTLTNAGNAGIPFYRPPYRIEDPNADYGERMDLSVKGLIEVVTRGGGNNSSPNKDDHRFLYGVNGASMIGGRSVNEVVTLFAGHFDPTITPENAKQKFDPTRDGVIILERDPVTKTPAAIAVYKMLIDGELLLDRHNEYMRLEFYAEKVAELQAKMTAGSSKPAPTQPELERRPYEPRATRELDDAANPATRRKRGGKKSGDDAMPPKKPFLKYLWCTKKECEKHATVVYVEGRQCACGGELKKSEARNFKLQVAAMEKKRIEEGGQPDPWATNFLKDFVAVDPSAAEAAPAS